MRLQGSGPSLAPRPPDIDLLLASLVLDYPAGSLLFLRADPSNPLAWRTVEGVDLSADSMMPDYLVLDGQQRLTSLSVALNGRGEHLFFMDLRLLEDDDLENAIYPLRRTKAEQRGLTTREGQFENHTYPLVVHIRWSTYGGPHTGTRKTGSMWPRSRTLSRRHIALRLGSDKGPRATGERSPGAASQ